MWRGRGVYGVGGGGGRDGLSSGGGGGLGRRVGVIVVESPSFTVSNYLVGISNGGSLA